MAEGGVAIMSMLPLISADDIPVWMVYFEDRPRPVLVSWANSENFELSRFLSLETFGTEAEAQEWLENFWYAFWVVMGHK